MFMSGVQTPVVSRVSLPPETTVNRERWPVTIVYGEHCALSWCSAARCCYPETSIMVLHRTLSDISTTIMVFSYPPYTMPMHSILCCYNLVMSLYSWGYDTCDFEIPTEPIKVKLATVFPSWSKEKTMGSVKILRAQHLFVDLIVGV